MEIINLDEYDLSYDIQFFKFMLKLLEPYIKFKKSGPNEEKEHKINIYRNTNYDWKLILARPPLYNCCSVLGHELCSKKNGVDLELISLQEYIHFIQCVFPRIIQYEIKRNKEEYTYEEC